MRRYFNMLAGGSRERPSVIYPNGDALRKILERCLACEAVGEQG